MPDSVLASVLGSYPTPWILGAALSSGMAIAVATRRRSREGDSERARSRRWLVVITFASVAVAAGLGALLAPGLRWIGEPKYLYLYLACTAAATLGARFPKTAGTSLVALLVLGGTIGLVFATALRPLSEGSEIGRVTVYAADQDGLDVEASAPDLAPVAAHLGGDRLVPMVQSIAFDDLWPFLGWRRWYRLEGMTACEVLRDGETVTVSWSGQRALFERPAGAPEVLYASFVKIAANLPGVRIVSVERLAEAAFRRDPAGTAGRVDGVGEYSLRLGGAAGFEIGPAGAQARGGGGNR